MFLLLRTINGANGRDDQSLKEIERQRIEQRERDRREAVKAREQRAKELREQLRQRTSGMRNPIPEGSNQVSKPSESPLERIKAAGDQLEKNYEKVLAKQVEVRKAIGDVKEAVKSVDPSDKAKLKELGQKLARLNIFDVRLQVLINRREANKTVNEARLQRQAESKTRIDAMVNERLAKQGISRLSKLSDEVDAGLIGRSRPRGIESSISRLDQNNSIYTTYKPLSRSERRSNTNLNSDVRIRVGGKNEKYISYKTKNGSGFNIDKSDYKNLKWDSGRKNIMDQMRSGTLTEEILNKYNISYTKI